MRIEFSVPGKPQAKGRPRFSRGGYAYTPKETATYENMVRLAYMQQCGEQKLSGMIGADIEAVFAIPKSTPKRNVPLMQAGMLLYAKKPDCDNLAKSVLDALNGVAFHDDSQVCRLTVKKAYGEKPRVDVCLHEITPLEEYSADGQMLTKANLESATGTVCGAAPSACDGREART